MADSNLETPDKSEEAQSPSFLLFGILNGISFVLTLVCLGFTIFSQAKANTDLNIFLWTTSGCAFVLLNSVFALLDLLQFTEKTTLSYLPAQLWLQLVE